jgi:hypothetical protein
MKLVVTEVYTDNGDGTYTEVCGFNCPTQDLLPGIAAPGDLINIEVTLEDWDVDPDTGKCSRTRGACSVSQQNCAGFFCTNGGGPCTSSDQCLAGATCEREVCNKSPLLGSFQWAADCSTYSNGGAPGLELAELNCSTDSDCYCGYTEVPGDFNDCHDFALLAGSFCTCTQAQCSEDNKCSTAAAVYIDSSNQTNYVYSGHSSLDVVDTSTCNVEVASASLAASGGVPEDLFRCSGGNSPECNVDADCDEGSCVLSRTGPYYLGTLLLQATSNACGVFAVDLNGDANKTFLRDSGAGALPSPIIEPLLIDFGDAVACNDGDPCTENDRLCGGVCAGDPIVCGPDETCVGGVCQPGCSFAELVSATWSDGSPLAADPFDRPGNCAIDARQPYPIDDAATKAGWIV